MWRPPTLSHPAFLFAFRPALGLLETAQTWHRTDEWILLTFLTNRSAVSKSQPSCSVKANNAQSRPHGNIAETIKSQALTADFGAYAWSRFCDDYRQSDYPINNRAGHNPSRIGHIGEFRMIHRIYLL